MRIIDIDIRPTFVLFGSRGQRDTFLQHPTYSSLN